MGRADGDSGMRRHLLAWAPAAVTAIAVVGCTAGGGDVTESSTGSASVPESTSASRTRTAPPTTVTSSTTPGSHTTSPDHASLPTTISAGQPLLDIDGGYELFARSPAAVARVEFAQGRVTVKPAPGIQSGAGAYFIAGSHAVIARAWDRVPGFLLPDDGPARELPGALASGGGQTLPGPELDRVWIAETTNGAESGVNALHLVGSDGEQTSTSIAVDGPPLGPDGNGYALAQGADGIYAVRPDSRTRILAGDGSIIAIGPTGWLLRPCGDDAACDDVYIDRTDGSRHPVAVHAESRQPGVISPDGTHAAVIATNVDGSGANELHLVELSTGVDTVIDLPSGTIFAGPSRGAAIVWSPDSRWLFVATGQILAVDITTGHAQELPGLPADLEFFQVAIRPAS